MVTRYALDDSARRVDDGTDRSEGVEHVAHVAVAHGDHDRHVGDGERAALGTRMDGTGVEQAFGEPL